jgi:2-amino-4-hydroxy-6-hydroxymethyldihydropteridine diphosphokinase
MNGIYLIIGGNMGDRENYLATCIQEIENCIGKIVRKSAIYETASWGNTEQTPYLNQVLFLYTNLNPQKLLAECLSIEKKMGRRRTVKWDSRIIDIDILFYDHEIIHDDGLTIPHPLLHERKFVLIPLNELSPLFIHPVSKKSIHELLNECKDPLEVKKFIG